jgi:hypothetical protein
MLNERNVQHTKRKNKLLYITKFNLWDVEEWGAETSGDVEAKNKNPLNQGLHI